MQFHKFRCNLAVIQKRIKLGGSIGSEEVEAALPGVGREVCCRGHESVI